MYRITYDAQGHTRIYRAVIGSFKRKADAVEFMGKLREPNMRVEYFKGGTTIHQQREQ